MANEKWLIDANALTKHTVEFLDSKCEQIKVDIAFWSDIENAPTVDAVEVVHGRWQERRFICMDSEVMLGYRCSRCMLTFDAETNSCVKGFGREYRNTTFFRCKDKKVRVSCGCFLGDIDEFRTIVKKTHKDSKMAKEYLLIADLMELHFANDGESREGKNG